MKSIKKPLFSICLLLLLLGGIIGVSQLLYKRFDLTSDKRYTLSPTTLQLLSKVKAPIDIKVLLKGNIPTEYKRLQTETLQLLEEYKAANKHIHFEFVNPLEGKDVDSQLQALSAEGFTPLMITSSTGRLPRNILFLGLLSPRETSKREFPYCATNWVLPHRKKYNSLYKTWSMPSPMRSISSF